MKDSPMSKPSEKAMQAAAKMVYKGCDGQEHFVGIENAAAIIQHHTAQALSEHKRAIEKCRVTLDLCQEFLMHEKPEYVKRVLYSVNIALAAIANLRKE
jgi:hypothetical protein